MNPWTLNAVAKIEKIKRGTTFTAEDLRKRMKDPPPHPNCVGAAFQAAHAKGLIEWFIIGLGRRPEARGHYIATWVRR